MAVESRPKDETDQSGKPGRGFVKLLPYALVGVVLIGYFVWMCGEMATEAPGGGAVPLSIFGGVLLGLLAGGASMIKTRRNR